MGNRLLLADDSITIQKVVAIIFANEEFELTVVDNGTAALEKAREMRPDVMLVDALMPGKTGYEVCAEIRRDPRLNSVPILLLIGAFEPLDEEKARDCGADASITKPFESQQLIDRVKELLEIGKIRSAAPAATLLPIESAAEELWGDLSSFDTMPPAAPAPPAPPAATVPEAREARPQATAPTVAAPVAAPMAAAPAAAAAPSSPLQPYFTAPKTSVVEHAPVQDEEIVEASYEDDLWGAFEVDELPVATPPAAPQGFGVLEPESDLVAEQFFSFEDESEAIEETGPAIDLSPAADEPITLPPSEDFFSFSEPQEVPAAEKAPASFPESAPISFDEPEASPAAPPPAEPAGAAMPPLEPQSVPLQQGAPVESAEPESVPPQPATFTLNEADLVAALSRISKEVIERIVWEVVPDLAEVLIKEEIRKLKEGFRG